jgi:hypothetical protein
MRECRWAQVIRQRGATSDLLTPHLESIVPYSLHLSVFGNGYCSPLHGSVAGCRRSTIADPEVWNMGQVAAFATEFRPQKSHIEFVVAISSVIVSQALHAEALTDVLDRRLSRCASNTHASTKFASVM